MFTKNYYGGNFYTRAKARFKSRGVKLYQRRGGPKPTKLHTAHPKSPSMLGKRSRASSVASDSIASPILYRPDRLNYAHSYSVRNNDIVRPDGSWYENSSGSRARGRPSAKAAMVLEKVVEDMVGSSADWLTKRRFAAKKKKSLRGKKLFG